MMQDFNLGEILFDLKMSELFMFTGASKNKALFDHGPTEAERGNSDR